jgi:hypothetical protein
VGLNDLALVRGQGARLEQHAVGDRDLAEDIVIKPKRGRARQREDPVAIALRKPHRLLAPLAT